MKKVKGKTKQNKTKKKKVRWLRLDELGKEGEVERGNRADQGSGRSEM